MNFNFFGGGFPGFEEFNQREEPSAKADEKDLYEVLGINKKASANEIKKKYFALAKTKHPDKGGDAETFKEIQAAYEILGDPEKRAIYDKYGIEGVKRTMEGGGHSGDLFDILNMFGMGGQRGGGGPSNKVRKNKAVKKELRISLENAYKGELIKMPHSCTRVCSACEGKGGKNERVCPGCKGKGVIEKMVQLMPGMYQQVRSHCGECGGEGKSINEKDKCKKCKGEKIVHVNKNMEVPIEKGVPERGVITMHGEGDELPGVMAGDVLLIVVFEPHPVFKRIGADLFMKKEISLVEALTGLNFEISHLDGHKIKIASARNEVISPKERKIIKGKGMPFYKDSMNHGNLIIEFDVKFPLPGQISNDQKLALQKVLPGKHDIPTLEQLKTHEIMEDFDPLSTNTNEEGGKKMEEEDEEENGGTRVQCGQQ